MLYSFENDFQTVMKMTFLYILAFACVLGAAVCLVGCKTHGGPIEEATWSRADRVEYAFHDSSTAPDYHRSYTIVVTPQEASISIDSYGTVLLKKTYELTSGQFQQVLTSLQRLGISSKQSKKVPPASGGTTEVFRLFEGNNELFYGFMDDSQQLRSTMEVSAESIPEALDSLFPQSIETMIESTRLRN